MSERLDVRCPRCEGSGFVPRFGHYAGGLCFRCNGKGTIKMRAAPDGSVDHDHRLGGGYPTFTDDCGVCHLPVAEWPVVVPAHFWGDFYDVYFPGRTMRVPLKGSRAKTQRDVRALVAAVLPKFRVKWINRVAA